MKTLSKRNAPGQMGIDVTEKHTEPHGQSDDDTGQPLTIEVARIIDLHPDLGINGYLCPFTQSSASFSHEREAIMNSPFFVGEVSKALERTLEHALGLCSYFKTSNSFAAGGISSEKLYVGAVIVAFEIAGVKCKRISGNPNVTITRIAKSS